MESEQWALEVRAHWAELLRSGQKKVEVRAYPLPDNLLGQRILIVCPPSSAPLLPQGGSPVPVSGLPDLVPREMQGASLVGQVVFSSVKRYASQAQFEADAALHCVPHDSPHAWQPGVTQECYGWVVSESTWEKEPQHVPHMTRHMRSLFAVMQGSADQMDN